MVAFILVCVVLFPICIAFGVDKDGAFVFSIMSILGVVAAILAGVYGCGAVLAGTTSQAGDGFSFAFCSFGLFIGSEIGRKIYRSRMVQVVANENKNAV